MRLWDRQVLLQLAAACIVTSLDGSLANVGNEGNRKNLS
jgi:hypothetical protein